MRNSLIMTTMKAITVTVLAALVAGLTGCKKDSSRTAIAVFITGSPQVMRAGDTEKSPLRVMDKICRKDTIVTGPNSQVTVEIGESILVQVLQGTSLRLDTIMDDDNNALFLESGTVLNKVSRLVKGRSYEVRTRTTLAAVRGTEFMMTAKETRSEVAVYKGSVEVTKLGTKEERPIKEGFKAVIEKDFTLEPLNELDKLYHEKISIKPFVGGNNLESPEELKEIEKTFKEKEEEIDKKIEELGPQPLATIRNKYKRVDIITLYTGRVIKGAILSRGENFSILTPQGLITVPRVAVKRVNVVK